MNRISRCDWLPESYLVPLGIRALSRKYTDHALMFFSDIINPLLTKLARSKSLDIGLVLFWRVYGPRRTQKKNLANIQPS